MQQSVEQCRIESESSFLVLVIFQEAEPKNVTRENYKWVYDGFVVWLSNSVSCVKVFPHLQSNDNERTTKPTGRVVRMFH